MNRSIRSSALCIAAILHLAAVFGLPAAALAQQQDSLQLRGTRLRGDGVPAARLPLANNPGGLHRPRFQTLTFGMSAGVMLPRVSDLAPLIDDDFRTVAFFALDFTIPVSEQPNIAAMVGLDCGLGPSRHHDHALTSVVSFSAVGLWRPEMTAGFHPLFGVGVGHGLWQYVNSNVEIEAAYTYPVLITGATIFHERLDLILRLPLLDVSTSYQDQTYTIAPAGPSLSFRYSID